MTVNSTIVSPVDYTSCLLAGGAVFEVLSSFEASPTRINKRKLHTVNNLQNSQISLIRKSLIIPSTCPLCLIFIQIVADSVDELYNMHYVRHQLLGVGYSET